MKHTNKVLNHNIESLLRDLAEKDQMIASHENHINELNQARKEIKLKIDDLEEAKIVLNSSN